MQQVLIDQNLVKKIDLVNLKSHVDIDNIKNVPAGLNSLKSKVDKLDVDKLVSAPVKQTKRCSKK